MFFMRLLHLSSRLFCLRSSFMLIPSSFFRLRFLLPAWFAHGFPTFVLSMVFLRAFFRFFPCIFLFFWRRCVSCTLPRNWDYRRIWYFMIKYGIYLSFIYQLVKVFIWEYAKYAHRYPIEVFAASLDQDAGPNFHNFRENIQFGRARILPRGPHRPKFRHRPKLQ